MYFEESELADGQPYFYVSFVMNNDAYWMKINSNTLVIVWNTKMIYDLNPAHAHMPKNLIVDPVDPAMFYLTG